MESYGGHGAYRKVVRHSRLDGADCQCGTAVSWCFQTGGAAKHGGFAYGAYYGSGTPL